MAGETTGALFERINMLRVTLSTIEEVSQNARRADALKTFRFIAKTARHSLDRDSEPLSVRASKPIS